MKLTETITDLLFDLSEIESPENAQLLIGDGRVLRSNLLKLYRATENTESHGVIIKIMAEAGYPWFAKLANAGAATEQGNSGLSKPYSEQADRQGVMSDDDFMSLLPVNGYFH